MTGSAGDMQIDELHQVLMRAYPLGAGQCLEQVHNGNNRVYRLRSRSPAPYDDMAVKLTRSGEGRSLAGKQTEYLLLEHLRHERGFVHVPRLLVPGGGSRSSPAGPAACLWNDAAVLSCYRWVDAQPCRGGALPLRAVARRYAQLRRALDGVDPAIFPAGLVPRRHRLLVPEGKSLALAPEFCFSAHAPFVRSRGGVCAASALLSESSAFLEQEIEDLRARFRCGRRHLDMRALVLTHQELSPSNFGCSAGEDICIIFDFDSVAMGLPLQDVAWLCATFCVDHRSPLDEVMRNMMILLDALHSHAVLPAGWQELLVPFMRLGYLDTIDRKLMLARDGIDDRLGFVREDVRCLRWLRDHGDELARMIGSGFSPA